METIITELDPEAIIKAEAANPIELFQPETMDDLISKITGIVGKHVPDVSTPKGRAEITSLAYKLSRTKTTLDNLGKDVVSDWKAKAKSVDNVRRSMRESLDLLKELVREPLDEWQKQEDERKRLQKIEEEIAIVWNEAIADNEQFDRDRLRREELAKREKEAAERERKIVEREAELRRKQAAQEQAERDARIKEEAAKRERERLEEVERQRIEREAKEKERREADQRNRDRVHKEIVGDFTKLGISRKIATDVVIAIAEKKVRHIAIKY